MDIPTKTEAVDCRGLDAIDADASGIGRIDGISLDAQTDAPEWALVKTGPFGAKAFGLIASAAAPHRLSPAGPRGR